MNKQYLKIVIANCITRFGDSIDVIAYGWMVYLMTGSPTVLATLFAVNGIPSFIFNFCIGPVVNRLNKKALMVISDLCRASIVVFTITMYSFDLLQVWHLYALTFLTSVFEAFSSPAAISIATMILKKDEYDKANGINSGISTISELVGFATAGMIIGFAGIKVAMGINAATFFISAFLVSLVKYKEKISEKITVNKYKEDFVSGMKYFKSHTQIAFIVIFFATFNFFLIPFSSQVPAYIKDVICKDMSYVGILLGTFFVGIFFGSTCTGKLRNKITVQQMIAIVGVSTFLAYLAYCVAPQITAVNPQIILLGIAGLVLGIPNGMMRVKIRTYFMTKVQKDYLTTTVGITNAFALCSVPLGGAVAGALLVKLSIPTVYVIFGTSLLLVTFGQLFIKQNRATEKVVQEN